MSAYADTSFLVSLYTPDANSIPAASQMKTAELPIFVTPFGETELINALELRIFRKEIKSPAAAAARRAFRHDVESGIFVLTAFPITIFERAKQISRRRTPRLGTRTLDVLHVASALVLRADTFYTFDQNQRKLAKAEGLKTP